MINFTRIYLIVFTFLYLIGKITSLICPNGAPFCIDVQISNNLATFTLQSTTKVGYMAIGLGTSMSDSEIFVGWFDNKGQPRISQSEGVGHTQPRQVNQLGLKLNNAQSRTNSNNQTIVFSRSLEPTFTGGKKISEDDIPMIWAYSENTPNDNGRISRHDAKGAFIYTTSLIETDEVPTDIPTIVLIHGILMLVGWLVMPSIAIYIARFMKGTLGVWWFRLHIGAFIIGGILALASIIVMVVVYGNLLNNSHSVVGVVVMCLYGLQILLGIYIDRMWNPERESIPFHDHLHWWLGRIILLLALANTFYGIVITGNPLKLWIPTAIILAGIMSAFTFGKISTNKKFYIEPKA